MLRHCRNLCVLKVVDRERKVVVSYGKYM